MSGQGDLGTLPNVAIGVVDTQPLNILKQAYLNLKMCKDQEQDKCPELNNTKMNKRTKPDEN